MRGQSLFAARFLFLEQAKGFIQGSVVELATRVPRCRGLCREGFVHIPSAHRDSRQAHHHQRPATGRDGTWH
jgi:putative component of membrane protein insertase Oxa1/YidC/SpoIIIJ protein YidD